MAAAAGGCGSRPGCAERVGRAGVSFGGVSDAGPAQGGRDTMAPTGLPGSQGGAAAASPTQNVRRFEMQGGVIVRSKNQTATAERGSFDARRNEAIMEGEKAAAEAMPAINQVIDSLRQGERLP